MFEQLFAKKAKILEKCTNENIWNPIVESWDCDIESDLDLQWGG